jgi:hypothetical protein
MYDFIGIPVINAFKDHIYTEKKINIRIKNFCLMLIITLYFILLIT